MSPAPEQAEFAPIVIASRSLRLGVIPELGGKIVELADETGRNWLWAPGDGRGLFRNQVTDDYARSPLVGVDECFPTVAACHWRGRRLPDHGELWAVPWEVRERSATRLALEVQAPISPFRFSRVITLEDAGAVFAYSVRNCGGDREPIVWALHPLLECSPGDYIEVPAEAGRIDSQINMPLGERGARLAYPEPAPGIRLDRLELGQRAAVKFFTDRLTEGRVAWVRPAMGRRLVFRFSLAEIDTLGIWINRGGWSGYQHVAIEPTNGAPDPLDTAVAWQRCQWIDPNCTIAWRLHLNFESL